MLNAYLQVSVHDAEGVQCEDTQAHLRQYLQNDLLLEHLVLLAHVLDSLAQIAAICVLHHQAQVLRGFVDKGSLVGNDIGMLHRC